MSHTMAESVANSPLFKLPPELRLRIYEYTMCGKRHIKITRDEGIPEPALLLTCKIIRDEAIASFYEENDFTLISHADDPAVMVLWESKLLHLAQSHDILLEKPGLRRTGPPNWNNLKQFFRLYHEEKVHAIGAHPPGSEDYDDEAFFIRGLFKAVCSMRSQPWSEMEELLDHLRPGLIGLRPAYRH